MLYTSIILLRMGCWKICESTPSSVGKFVRIICICHTIYNSVVPFNFSLMSSTLEASGPFPLLEPFNIKNNLIPN